MTNQNNNKLNSVITQVIHVSPSMKIIRIKPNGWSLPQFESGQFVVLGLYENAPRKQITTNSSEGHIP